MTNTQALILDCAINFLFYGVWFYCITLTVDNVIEWWTN